MRARPVKTSAGLASSRFALAETGRDRHRDDFARDVRAGLTGAPKRLPCRYFYDGEGSMLFEEICTLPEYYLTRAEHEILDKHAATIAAGVPAEVTLVELGSGSAAKTRLLIEALLRSRERLRYVPVDISRRMLEASSQALLDHYARLEITAIAGEYEDGLELIAAETDPPRLVVWLGSNIGNLDRVEATAFLRRLRAATAVTDQVLCGVDLRKDRAGLERAYDDARGVTARFNLNLLARINRELGGRFPLGTFRHRAVYDEAAGRMSMYLVSARAQRVRIDALGLDVEFAADETIHTEDSYKYSLAEIDALGADGGFRVKARWLDHFGRFSVNLLVPA